MLNECKSKIRHFVNNYLVLLFYVLSNNKKLTSDSAIKRTSCNDLKERKLDLLMEDKESEIIFCVIIKVTRIIRGIKKPLLKRKGSEIIIC